MRLVLLSMGLLIAAPAAAFEVGLRGTSTTPTGHFDTDEPTGTIGLLFRITEGPLALGVAVEGGEDSGSYHDWHYSFESLPAVLADAQFRFSDGFLQPFVGGSAGIAFGSNSVAVEDMHMSSPGPTFMLHPAAGLRLALPVIPVALEGDVGLRMLFVPGVDSTYLDDVGGMLPSFAARLALVVSL